MHLFYYPRIEGEQFKLDKIESGHCIKVLRLSAGDIIYLTDGTGKFFKAKITVPDRNACVTEILQVINVPPERDYSLQIAISPTKNIDRFEWFLEKITEIGADKIIPVLCNNSERRVIKTERLKRVMIAAIKQSLKARLPEINSLLGFEALVNQQFDGQKFIATGNEPPENHLGKLYHKKSDVLILIGPEGDFQKREMNMALQYGFIPVSLAGSRLRTETAGVVACHAVNFLNYLS